jgi:non-heme chloroperoxidase
LQQVILNGWSLGGAVVVAAAAQLETVCAGLVLTGGASPVYVQKPDFPHGGTVEDMQGTLAALAEDRVNFLQGLSQIICAKEVSPAIQNWFWQIFLQSSPLAAATLGELATLDQREMLASLPMPILSFVGDQDGFVDPDICRWVGDNNANATVVEFPGVGHAPFIEAQAEYLAALSDFVASSIGK